MAWIILGLPKVVISTFNNLKVLTTVTRCEVEIHFDLWWPDDFWTLYSTLLLHADVNGLYYYKKKFKPSIVIQLNIRHYGR